MADETYEVIQVYKDRVSELKKLIKEKGLSHEDLILILHSTRLRDVKFVGDKFCLRSPYERSPHLADMQPYLDTLRINSARLSGIEFEEI